jgi:hypothetical protein
VTEEFPAAFGKEVPLESRRCLTDGRDQLWFHIDKGGYVQFTVYHPAPVGRLFQVICKIFDMTVQSLSDDEKHCEHQAKTYKVQIGENEFDADTIPELKSKLQELVSRGSVAEDTAARFLRRALAYDDRNVGREIARLARCQGRAMVRGVTDTDNL